MKRLILVSSLIIAVVAPAAPTATVKSVVQNDDESVTVDYDLDEAAVVTLSVVANGIVLDDRATQHVRGDVNRKLSAGNGYTMTWFPDIDWPGHKYSETSVKMRLTAWPTDDTPDYLVVDLNATSDARVRYYTSTNALPGGLLDNKEYRETKMVFRKIRAKGITWRMGEDGAQHDVTLDHNYYIGVFELTARQHDVVYGKKVGYFTGVEWWMRAVDERNLLSTVRGNTTTCLYPNAPDATSVLGKMRTLCGGDIDFDLPGEAQWEFAARAGNPNGYWGDGSKESISENIDVNLSRLARYRLNGGFIGGALNPYNSCNFTTGPTNGVAIVGSHAPNAWGLYDMHGNCAEYCIDLYKADITKDGGAIIVPTSTGYNHALRGGRYQDNPSSCRFTTRWGESGYSGAGGGYGCRFACRAGLK